MDASSLGNVVQHAGYVAIILIIGLESAGLPLPGEATLVAAAVLAATTHVLSLPLVIGAAAAAAIMGDNIGFWIGRRFGTTLLRRYGPRVGLDAARQRLGRYLFARYGGRILFFGRFVAVLRTTAALLAGANHYPWRSFLAYNAAGGLTWATLYGCAAYWFGHAMHRVSGPLGTGLLVCAGIAAVFAWRALRRQEVRLQAEADRAMPDEPAAPAATPAPSA